MRLYIKQDMSIENQLFIVYDELCNEKYFIKGNKDKLYLVDLSGETLLRIRRIFLPTLKAFSITAQKQNIKFIMNNSNKFSNCYFYGVGWRVRGNVFIKSFDIIDADNSLIATHIKRFSPCGDGYELNVINESKELFSIATAICVNLEAKVDNPRMQTV